MRSFLFGLGCLAILATACTAIVAGKVGGKDDYKKTDTPSSTSGNLEKCSLLMVAEQKNACSDCIETRCKEDVEYACQKDGTQEKPWFKDLKDCAQQPYLNFSSSFYDCNVYEDAGPAINATDDSAKRRASERCVMNNCMAGATPPCRLCPVQIQKPKSSEKAKLGESDCGRCLEDNCAAEIVQCCETQAVSQFIAKCGYAEADQEYKAGCNQTAALDGGTINGSSDTKEGKACQITIRDCYISKCQERCQ